MLRLNLERAADLSGRLVALPDALRAALLDKVESLARSLLSQVVDVNLNGGVVNKGSGALRDSIQLELQQQDQRIGADIFSNGDVPYAAILEFGGKTAAHEILPDKAGVLSFVMNGKQVFARRIQHPGSVIAARSYMGSAIDDQREDIAQGLQEIVIASAAQLKES